MTILVGNWYWASGQAIYPFILVRRKDVSITLLNHEHIHLEQQKELFVIGAYLFYLIEFLVKIVKYANVRVAYNNISFEREAFFNQSNFSYLHTRKKYSFLQYI